MKINTIRLMEVTGHLREEAGQLTFVAAELSGNGFQIAARKLLNTAADLSEVADAIDPDGRQA